MLAHEFLGAGDGLQSFIDDINRDGADVLAAGYTHYPEGSISVPEGNRQVGALIWDEMGVLHAIVSQATLDYNPRGAYDARTTEVRGDAVRLEESIDGTLPFRGQYYRVSISENVDSVEPADYLIWKPDKPAVSPLGFLAIERTRAN